MLSDASEIELQGKVYKLLGKLKKQNLRWLHSLPSNSFIWTSAVNVYGRIKKVIKKKEQITSKLVEYGYNSRLFQLLINLLCSPF